MNPFHTLTKQILAFRDARDWQQFHNPKDLAIALGIEAGELQELFLWKKEGEVGQVAAQKVAKELADVLIYALLLTNHYQFDPVKIIEEKLAENAAKYPVEKAKGRSDKYTDLSD